MVVQLLWTLNLKGKPMKPKRQWQPKLRAATFADKRTKRLKTRQAKNKSWKKDQE